MTKSTQEASSENEFENLVTAAIEKIVGEGFETICTRWSWYAYTWAGMDQREYRQAAEEAARDCLIEAHGIPREWIENWTNEGHDTPIWCATNWPDLKGYFASRG